MNVLVVEPGTLPYEKEIDGLKEMQALVGGSIQAIYPYKEPVAIVCNGEGLLLELPFNRSVEGGYGGVLGNFFVCGLTADDFCSLTPEQMQTYKKEFHFAEIPIAYQGNEVITLKVQAESKNKPPKEKQRDAPERG